MEHVYINGPKQRSLRGINDYMVDWMKTHNVQDLRDMVFELYNRGETVSEMVGLVHDLDTMMSKTHATAHEVIETEADYDILSYVEELEQAKV